MNTSVFPTFGQYDFKTSKYDYPNDPRIRWILADDWNFTSETLGKEGLSWQFLYLNCTHPHRIKEAVSLYLHECLDNDSDPMKTPLYMLTMNVQVLDLLEFESVEDVRNRLWLCRKKELRQMTEAEADRFFHLYQQWPRTTDAALISELW